MTGRQERTTWTAWEAPERHPGDRKGPIGQPARHQGGRKGSIGQHARLQGGRKDQLDSLRGTREAGKSYLDSLGGTRETRRTGLPIESRFWKGAGFCITFNTISMAIGSVRGKSWGGLHGWLPVAQTSLLKKPPGAQATPDFGRAPDFVQLSIQFQWRSARFAVNPGGPHGRLPVAQAERRIAFDREAPGRQERINWTA